MPVSFADRMQCLSSSGIRKMFELAATMKNPVDLSLGQPDFDVPDQVKQAAIKAIQEGNNGYTQTAGIAPFRDAIAAQLSDEGIEGRASIAVAGASGGLLLAILCIVGEGDEVLIQDPCFVAYEPMIRLAGGTPVRVDTYPDLRMTRQRLEAVTTDRTKMLIFNSPGNPTGVMQTKEEIADLAAFAKERKIQVVADEVYDQFVYDEPHHSWAQEDPDTILVRAFSKTWGMPGWRVGYVVGPEETIQAMATLQQFSFVCVNQPSQWACIEALKTDMGPTIREYQRKRDKLYDALKDDFEIIKPEGTFFMFPRAPGGDGDRFLEECLKEELLIVPGKVFSPQNTHFRVSFAATDATLDAGIVKLRAIAKRLRGMG